MHVNDIISIASAVNGGFVITCTEKRGKPSSGEIGSDCCVPYVAKDVSSAMKIIKGKLEECLKEVPEEMAENKHSVIKNAY